MRPFAYSRATTAADAVRAMAAAPDLAIRLARAAFNRALAERDLNAIAALLVSDVVMVTGTDSAVLAGRKAQLLAWKREFAAAHPTTSRMYSQPRYAVSPSLSGMSLK